jgi:hypothetical protein
MAKPVSAAPPAKKQPTPPELRGKRTRAQAAARLGVSISKVRTMEGTALHPEVINGVHYFAAEEIDEAACSIPASSRGRRRLDDGQIAARVFRLIDNGKELREIVEELEVTPQHVRILYREWKTDFLSGEDDRLRAEQDASEERHLRQMEKDADRQSRDLDRMMKATFGK